MDQKKRIFSITAFSLAFLITASSMIGQAPQPTIAESNYDVVLHVLVASSPSGQGEALPTGLSTVAKQIRGEFGSSNLKLINTYLGRLSNTGNLEYKGVSNAYVQEPEAGSPSFLDWKLSGLKTLQNSAGQDVFQFQSFRFGARIPVRINFRDDSGKPPTAVNYEAIGLTLDRMSVRENSPTLVGTLTQPKTDGTLFLILTVKSADK